MKFLSTAEEELLDKKLKLKVKVPAPTNAVRFALYDLGRDESLEGRIRMSEYIYDHCVSSVHVGTREITPDLMKQADLADEKTAEVYFRCVDMVVNHQLSVDEEAEKKSV